MLEPIFFKANRQALRKLLGGDGLILLSANGLMQRTGDVVYDFRQDSNFYYLTGITEPDILLLIDLESSEEFLVLPKKTEVELIFGGNIDCDEVAKISSIQNVYEYNEGWDKLKKLQLSRKKIYTIIAPPVKITHTDNFFTNGNRRLLIQKLKRLDPPSEFIDIRRELATLRQVKQPAELELIKTAIQITASGLERVQSVIKPGTTWHQIKAELDYVFAKNGSQHAWPAVIGIGEDTAIIHTMKTNRSLNKTDTLLIDVGAEHELYSADVSRTYFVGQPTKRQQAVYDAVKQVQQEAIKLLKPHLAWREYALKVDRLMGEQLLKLGLIKQNDRKQVRKYFSHAASHSLGLDVHDVCLYENLEENMVITVEPGIYIPEEGFGVRIEDDILITKNGSQNLSGYIS